MLSLKTILLSLALMCFAHASLAEPIYINLLPEGKEKEKIEVPLQAAELSSSIKNMLIDLGAVTQKMRTDKIKHYVDLPVNHADKRTLSAIANALMAMQNLKRKNKEYRFGPMKSIVKNFCFPTSKPATSTDLLNFLLLANFLDIGDLLRPTTAAWAELKQKEGSQKEITKAQLKELLPKDKLIPEELLPLFEDSLNWLNNPASLIKPIGQPIAVGGRPNAFAVVGNKLYVGNYETNGTVSVIDLATDRVIGDPIAVGKYPAAFAVAGNKLYVANYQSNTVSVIDTATDRVIRDPIAVGMHPYALAVVGNKLYVVHNEMNGTVSVIDLATEQVIGDPIAVGRYPTALAVAGNKLYVSNRAPNGTLMVIDPATDRVIGKPIKVGSDPHALAVVGNKLYVANSTDNNLSVINLATHRVSLSHMTGKNPSALVVAGNKLYVANFGESTLSVIDPITNEVMRARIKIDSNPSALASVGNKLYVAKYDPLDTTGTFSGTVSVLDLEMFNYYNYTPDR